MQLHVRVPAQWWAWWATVRVQRQRLAAARAAKRRAELMACCGYVSDRWLQSNHYAAGKRRGEE
jgi:hypothetical protein